MRTTICLAAALAFCASAAVAKPATFDIKNTTWTFVDKKDGKLKESIEANGNYITNTIGGKHIDHGTAVMKDSKACFTSAMTKDGEICWTTPPHAMALGHTFVTTSDKGE